MILENGVVRTLDPSLPTARALAIAGDARRRRRRHARARAAEPGRRRSRRALRRSRLHGLARPLPDLVALAARGEARRRRRASRRRSSAFALASPHGSWIRGYGWRSAEWDEQPTAAALDAVTGETPALLFSKDYHSAWLNSAALALAEGELEVEGGVVERDAAGAPTGILREESAWQFRARCRDAERGRVRRGDARGASDRCEPRRRRDPRQGRLARRARDLPARRRARRTDAARLAVGAVRAAARARRRSASTPVSATTSCGSAT